MAASCGSKTGMGRMEASCCGSETGRGRMKEETAAAVSARETTERLDYGIDVVAWRCFKWAIWAVE